MDIFKSHLLHPLFIHFPIAFLFLGGLLFITKQFFPKTFSRQNANLTLFHCLTLWTLGTIGMALSLFTGDLALESAQQNSSALIPIYDHEQKAYWTFYSSILTLGLFLFLQHNTSFLNAQVKSSYLNKALKITIVFFVIVTLTLTFVTSHRGALLVYKWGVGVENK